MTAEQKICAATVDEHTSRLASRPHQPAVFIRIEYQSSAFCQRIRADSPAGRSRQVHNQPASRLMNVRTDVGEPRGREKLLRIPVKSIVSLGGKPPIDVIAISN